MEIFDWIRNNDTLLWWLAVLSAVTFIGTLLAVPWLVVRIPADYFVSEERRPVPWDNLPPALRLSILILKNILGGLFIAAGITMLLLPGQGLLTIVLGVLLLDFPYKFRFERWLVSRRNIHRSINWIRRRRGKPPLAIPAGR